jgi:UDP-N-acetyl-D-galactosamine dehydrogenase
MIGYKPRIILAGRNINDNMGKYVVSQFIIEMKKKSIQIKKAKILIMGLTFKENCLDIRNSGSQIIVNELNKLGCDLDLYDPVADKMDIKKTYGVLPITKLIKNTYDGIIIVVAHDYFKNMDFKTIHRLCKKNCIIYDLKYIFTSNQASLRL